MIRYLKLLSPRRRLPAITLAIALSLATLLWQTPDQVSAHANQIRTSPAPDSVLDESPDRIVVWFSEPIEPRLSRIRVLDENGVQVDNEDSILSPTEPTAVVVTVPELENGTYTAVWGNTSTVDGHSVVGSFRFAIGEPLSDTVQVVEQPLLQSAGDPWIRWLFFIGALGFAGSLLFEILVIVPGLGNAAAGTPGNRIFIRVTRLLPRVLWASLGLMVFGMLSLLVQQASVTFDVSLFDTLGEPLRTILFDSNWGRQWMWRILAVVAAGILLELARQASGAASHSDDDEPIAITETIFGQLALAASLAVLFLTTFSSHNAAVPEEVRVPAIISDFIHLIAAAVWIGGLFFLAISLRVLAKREPTDEIGPVMAEILPRFTTVALVSAGTLIVTGIFSGWMQVTIPEATATPHGWALLAKVLLLVPLFGIAAANSFWVTKNLISDRAKTVTLTRLVSTEALLGLLILLAVGWMAGLEPARQFASRNGIGVDESRRFEDTAEGTNIELEVAPGNVGVNSVTVKLRDLRGNLIENANQVRVRLRFLEDDLAEPTQTLTDRGDGVWRADDFRITIGGIYQAEVVVVRPDAFDAQTAFRFEAFSSGGLADAIRPGTTPTWVLFGIELLLIGALIALAGTPALRSVKRPSIAITAPGGAVAALGIVLVLNASVLRVGFTEDEFNPFPPTPASLESGAAVYASNCSTCHGVEGLGDGPEAGFLAAPPADLTIHVPLHTDGELFGFIRDGIPGTVMRANEGILSEEEMWHLVNYIRTFE